MRRKLPDANAVRLQMKEETDIEERVGVALKVTTDWLLKPLNEVAAEAEAMMTEETGGYRRDNSAEKCVTGSRPLRLISGMKRNMEKQQQASLFRLRQRPLGIQTLSKQDPERELWLIKRVSDH